MPHPPILTEHLPNFLSFDLLLVEGGEFLMGGADKEALEWEKPVHLVKLPSFYLGKYPVTQAVWQAVMGSNPSNFKGDNRPVENVSWNDAQQFIETLNKETNKMYRLPTEAEWEFAARGGIHSEGYVYAGSDKLKQVGWYVENSNNETKEVGQKLGNELGLYDMSGNVYEWCHDWYGEKYYDECHRKGLVENPQGPASGANRVIRGGGYFFNAQGCRAAYRLDYGPASRNAGIGFRLALSLQADG